MRLVAAYTEKHPPSGAVFPNHLSVTELADGRVQVAVRGSVQPVPGTTPRITQAQIVMTRDAWNDFVAQLERVDG